MTNYHDIDIDKVLSDLTDIAKDKKPGAIPFSNGTEAMGWDECNCMTCVRNLSNHLPDDVDVIDDPEGEVRNGRDCIGKYSIDLGYLIGSIPTDVVEWMGGTWRKDENGIFAYLPNQCRHYSEDDRDKPNYTPLVPEDPNQLLIPFDITDLFGFDDPEIIVTKYAIAAWNH